MTIIMLTSLVKLLHTTDKHSFQLRSKSCLSVTSQGVRLALSHCRNFSKKSYTSFMK